MARLHAVIAGAFSVCAVAFTSIPALSSDLPAHKVLSIDGDASARKLAVRLDARLGEQQLKELAAALAKKAKAGERVAALNFYLPRMELAQTPWASVKLDAEIAVSVLGLRLEEERAFRADAERDGRDLVGAWLTSPPALPGRLVIVRAKGGKLFAEWQLRAGQKTVDEVVVGRATKGMRYDIVGGNGAYYLATWSGDLLLGDASRVIAVAERLVLNKPSSIAANAKDNAKESAKPSPAEAAKNAQQVKPDATEESVAAQPAEVPGAAVVDVPKPRRTIRVAKTRKSSGSSVADLMMNSQTR